jgi:hypothetical protein
MSISPIPPDEGKSEDIATPPGEERPPDTAKPVRKRKPRDATKTARKRVSRGVVTAPGEGTSGEVALPTSAETPVEVAPPPEVATPMEGEASGEVASPTSEEPPPEVATPMEGEASGEVASPTNEEPPPEVAIPMEGEASGEVVTPPDEGSSPDVATPLDEEASSEVVILTEEEILSEVVISPEEGTSPAAEITSDEEAPVASEHESVEVKPRDAAYWAQQASTLRVSHVPTGALNLNVEGKQAVGPLQGFGQMWQKTYRVSLKGASVQPMEVIKIWKEHFTQFWPKGNRFYAPLTGIAPGEVALIKLSIAGGLPLSTGVLVLYADEESFTLMTPQGHSFAGWITFSSHKEDDYTVAQVQVLVRTNDPAYEIGFRLGASKAEDAFWQRTLKALAAHFEVVEVEVETTVVCIDPKVQWSRFWNIWHNGVVRTVMYRLLTPVRWVFKRSSR